MNFYEKGCMCNIFEGGCIKKFEYDEVVDTVLSVRELSSSEHDILVMGQLQALTPREIPNKKSKGSEYMYRGERVCRKTFCYLNGIGDKRLKNLKAHFKENNVSTRMHGNTKKLPVNVTKVEDVEDCKSFIDNFVLSNSINLPGRIPGYKSENILLLPTSHTKTFVHSKYKEACESAGKTIVSYYVFRHIWANFFPNVIATNPRTDLCFKCQQNISTVLKARNKSDDEKSKVIETHLKHLRKAKVQRQDYQRRCALSKDNVSNYELDQSSLDFSVTYSFDFAQQVSYPNNPDQPGDIFFKVPRKASLFGVSNEGLEQQVLFL